MESSCFGCLSEETDDPRDDILPGPADVGAHCSLCASSVSFEDGGQDRFVLLSGLRRSLSSGNHLN